MDITARLEELSLSTLIRVIRVIGTWTELCKDVSPWLNAQVVFLNFVVGWCVIFTQLWESKRVWYLSLRVFLVFKWGCEWAEKRREQESPTHESITHPSGLSVIIPSQPAGETQPPTHTCTFSHTHTRMGSGAHRHTFAFIFTSKHLILATHKLHCVHLAATVEQYTLPNSYGLCEFIQPSIPSTDSEQ